MYANVLRAVAGFATLSRAFRARGKVIVAVAIAGLWPGRANAQQCECFPGNPPPPALEYHWNIEEYNEGGGDGPVAVIVDRSLYNDPMVRSIIPTYLGDLVTDGYSYYFVTFSGSVEQLRAQIKELSPDGVVLVGGGLPWAMYGPHALPCEAYLMDIDDNDSDWIKDPETGVYESWPGDHKAQIWVSRIKADNLPEILGPDDEPATEAYIVQQYLLRNHELRWNAFDPAQNVLVYQDGVAFDEFCPCETYYEDPTLAMLAAFQSVEAYCQASEISPGDYIERLGRTGPSPESYDYIFERAHGAEWFHEMYPGVVHGSDYLAVKAMGISLISCGCANFSWLPYTHPELPAEDDARGYVAGDACFGPLANTLVVSGYSNEEFQESRPYALWTRVGAARSYGDGYRAQFNGPDADALGMVLLGDGSIKGASYDWTGGAPTPGWMEYENWPGGVLPGPNDRVRIDNVEVQVSGIPDEVWSIDLRNRADLSLVGDGTVLASHTSLVADEASENTLHMGQRTTLSLGSQGSLCNLTVTMDDTSDGTTHLSAGRLVSNCSGVAIGLNCELDVAKLVQSSVSSVEGALNVTESVAYCQPVTLAAGGALTTAKVEYSRIDVPAGAVFTNSVQDSDFTVSGGTVTVHGDASTCDFDIPSGTVTVDGAVEGWREWILSGGHLTAGASCFRGTLSIAGGGDDAARFERLSTLPLDGATLVVSLQDGAGLELKEVPASQPTFRDGSYHELQYGDGANAVFAGTQVQGGALYLGGDTVLRKAVGASGANLNLDLSCGFSVASDFLEPDVRANWDSAGVNVTLEAIQSGSQSIELISGPTPAVFADAPSHGRFGTLTLPAGSGAAVVTTADVYSNHWPQADAEHGIFETVVVGAGRTLRFTTYPPEPGHTANKIYYYGAAPTIEGAIKNKYGQPISPPSLVIQAVPYTYYGDWSPANCVITNIELALLQQAIAGGPTRYAAYMDWNSDGVLNNLDLARFMANYAAQPGCAGGGGGMDESAMSAEGTGEGVDDSEAVDVAELGAWLASQLTTDQLAAIVAQATATAEEHADDAVGADILALLAHLPAP